MTLILGVLKGQVSLFGALKKKIVSSKIVSGMWHKLLELSVLYICELCEGDDQVTDEGGCCSR